MFFISKRRSLNFLSQRVGFFFATSLRFLFSASNNFFTIFTQYMVASLAFRIARRLVKYNVIVIKVMLLPALAPVHIAHRAAHSVFVLSCFFVYIVHPPPENEQEARRRTLTARILHAFSLDESYYPSFGGKSKNDDAHINNYSVNYNARFGVRTALATGVKKAAGSAVGYVCGDVVIESYYGSFLRDFAFAVTHPPKIVYGPGLIPVYSTPDADYVISFGGYGGHNEVFEPEVFAESFVSSSSSKPVLHFPKMLGVEDTVRLFDYYDTSGFWQAVLPKLLVLYVLASRTASYTLV